MEILLDKLLQDGPSIEANTMIDMARREIAPAVSGYAAELAHTAAAKKAVDSSLSCGYETELLKKLAMLEDQIMIRSEELQEAVLEIQDIGDISRGIPQDPGYCFRKNGAAPGRLRQCGNHDGKEILAVPPPMRTCYSA